jgi:hypothetical protein
MLRRRHGLSQAEDEDRVQVNSMRLALDHSVLRSMRIAPYIAVLWLNDSYYIHVHVQRLQDGHLLAIAWNHDACRNRRLLPLDNLDDIQKDLALLACTRSNLLACSPSLHGIPDK